MAQSRRVNSDGDTFVDRFAPLAVHLYIAAPAGSVPASGKEPSFEGVRIPPAAGIIVEWGMSTGGIWSTR